jgi:hypothetical protein
MPGSLFWNVAGVSWSRNRFMRITQRLISAAAMYAHCENRERELLKIRIIRENFRSRAVFGQSAFFLRV